MSWNIKTPGDYINGPLTVAGATSIGGGVSLTTGSSNHFLKEGTGWIWTSTGTSGGTVRGGIYSINTGLLNLFGGPSIAGHLQINSDGNIGVGLTPANFGANQSAIESPYGTYVGRNQAFFGSNFYYNGADRATIPGWVIGYLQVPSNGRHLWLTSNASKNAGDTANFQTLMALNPNGALSLYGGNVTANGVGLTFPAAQVASTDANTLDDYEEGAWTATLRGGTSEPANLGQVAGRYTKIGRQVTVHAAFENVDTTGYAGAIRISGLPFANSSIRTMGAAGTFTGATFSETQIIALTASDTVLEFMDIRSNLSWTASTHNPGAGRYFWATLTYTVA